MVESTAFETRQTLTGLRGSNPLASAKFFLNHNPMRRYLFLVSILAVVLITSGCWLKPAYDLTKPNDYGETGKTTDQPECLVQLEIYRDGNAFKDKNFGDKINVDD